MAALKASGSGTARSRSLAFSQTADERGRGSEAVVLLTGFGPFPGVERNASAELALLLARIGAERHGHVRFVADVLPVDWKAAPLRIAELVRQHRPAVSLNFGVSARASGFVIEAYAYNETKDVPDDRGKSAGSFELISGDRPRRSATLPVRRIVRELQRAGLPAELSSDPGRYLCNAVLFHSLRHATQSTPRMRTGFIHIPATLEAGVGGDASLLSWQDTINGGLQLLVTCLPPLRLSDRVLF